MKKLYAVAVHMQNPSSGKFLISATYAAGPDEETVVGHYYKSYKAQFGPQGYVSIDIQVNEITPEFLMTFLTANAETESADES